MYANTLSLGKRFPLWLFHGLTISYTYQVLIGRAGFGPGARCLQSHLPLGLLLHGTRWFSIRQQLLQQLQLPTGSRHGEEWRGGSSSRCLLMPFLRKTAPPAPPHSTVYRFELVIWSPVCLLGLPRVGQRGSVTWVRTGCSSSRRLPAGASTRRVFVPGEHGWLWICSRGIKR